VGEIAIELRLASVSPLFFTKENTLNEVNEIRRYATQNELKYAQNRLQDFGLEVAREKSGWGVRVYLPSEMAQQDYRRLWVPAALVGAPLACGKRDEKAALLYAADNFEALLAHREELAKLYRQGFKAACAPSGQWHIVVYQPDAAASKELVDVPVSSEWPSVEEVLGYAVENFGSLIERRQFLENRYRELVAVGFEYRLTHEADGCSKLKLLEDCEKLIEDAKVRLAEQCVLRIGLPEELRNPTLSESEQKLAEHLKSWLRATKSAWGHHWIVLCGESAQRIASSALIALARESQRADTAPWHYVSAWELLRDSSLTTKLKSPDFVLDLATLVPQGTNAELAERLTYLMLPEVVSLLQASSRNGDSGGIIVSRASAQTVKRPLRTLADCIQDRFIDVDGVAGNPFENKR